jgi:polysaccharide export outer membrane protein
MPTTPKLKPLNFSIFVFFAFIFVLPSCVDTRKAVYFNNITDSNIPAATKDLEPVIQQNDIIAIHVSSLNPEASLIFNTPKSTNNVSGYGGTSVSGEANGYLVNPDGTIQFPVLGNLKAVGLTKSQLRTQIIQSLLDKKLLVDPIVDIRFVNFRVTVLGEVGRPAVVNVPNEKISILEAIGMAGDLTIYANRENVLLIREVDGNKEIKRLNLNSNEIFTSPYYYLRSNDIVYAEPNKTKVRSTSQSWQILPIVLASLSFLVIVADRLWN